MASPTIGTFCCPRANGSHSDSLEMLLQFDAVPYNIVCMMTSAFGFIGGVYQIKALASEVEIIDKNIATYVQRQRAVIRWLAIADMLAATGVFLRALSWLTSQELSSANPYMCPSTALFCAIISGWIQFFYTSTYFWTLFYAINVLLTISDKENIKIAFYHGITWGVSIIFTVTGLTIMYYPNFDCHRNEVHGFLYNLPNYLFTYIPITMVLIANPVIYKKALAKIGVYLATNRGKMTISEYESIDTIRVKFFFINIAFYICWLPNVINGFVVWLAWFTLPKVFIVTLWYMMAVVNPLQALFNAFIYRQWKRKATTQPSPRDSYETSSAVSSGERDREPLVGQPQPNYSTANMN